MWWTTYLGRNFHDYENLWLQVAPHNPLVQKEAPFDYNIVKEMEPGSTNHDVNHHILKFLFNQQP